METQTDDSLLDLVERGESAELEATSAKHIEHGRSTRGVGMEAVGGPLSPRRRLSRRYSARLMAPRNNKPVHGGYSALTLGDPVAAAADHAGDVEMQARGEGLYAEPAVENPLWEVGGGGAREGQGQGQGQKEGVGEESSALGSPVPALLRFFRGGSVK